MHDHAVIIANGNYREYQETHCLPYSPALSKVELNCRTLNTCFLFFVIALERFLYAGTYTTREVQVAYDT